MASFLEGSTEMYDHGSGTPTKMEAKYDAATCICMWEELAGKETLQSFADLVTLWYRNLEEYVSNEGTANAGTVASGELPFAMHFLSPGWLPEIKVEGGLKTLRDHFCKKDESASEDVVSELIAADGSVVDVTSKYFAIKESELYASFSQDNGRGELKTTLKKLGFKGVTQSVVTKPLEGFIAFMASHDYKEPENGGKYGATGKNDDEEKGGDDDDDDEGGGEEEDDDESEEDEDDEDDE